MPETVRVDRWLWATRFYKTRARATEACREGRIRRGGLPLKPAAAVSIGDRLEIPSHDRTHTRQIEVLALEDVRVGASLAQTAYRDHTPADIIEAAAERRAEQKTERLFRHGDDQGRMTKKLRRDWAGSQPDES